DCGFRIADCGFLRATLVPSSPQSAIRNPQSEAGGGAVKIAVLFDTLHPDWEDADYKQAVEAKVEEAEYAVARGLMVKGHSVLRGGGAEMLEPVLEHPGEFQPQDSLDRCTS